MTQSAVVLLTTRQQLSHGLELNCESSIITHNSTLGVPIGVPTNGPAQSIFARPYTPGRPIGTPSQLHHHHVEPKHQQHVLPCAPQPHQVLTFTLKDLVLHPNDCTSSTSWRLAFCSSTSGPSHTSKQLNVCLCPGDWPSVPARQTQIWP